MNMEQGEKIYFVLEIILNIVMQEMHHGVIVAKNCFYQALRRFCAINFL